MHPRMQHHQRLRSDRLQAPDPHISQHLTATILSRAAPPPPPALIPSTSLYTCSACFSFCSRVTLDFLPACRCHATHSASAAWHATCVSLRVHAAASMNERTRRLPPTPPPGRRGFQQIFVLFALCLALPFWPTGKGAQGGDDIHTDNTLYATPKCK